MLSFNELFVFLNSIFSEPGSNHNAQKYYKLLAYLRIKTDGMTDKVYSVCETRRFLTVNKESQPYCPIHKSDMKLISSIS
jgi:hypothetical protein